MNVNRISGLASGMDTDTLIKKLMDAERIPFNKLKQNREKLNWQSEAYRKWNTEIFSFRSKTLFDMKMSSTYNTFTTASSDEAKVSAVANGDAIEGLHTLKVTQTAAAASVNATTDTSRTLSEDSEFVVKVTNAKGEVRQATISLKAGQTVKDAVAALNAAVDAGDGKTSLGLQAAYDDNLKQFVLKTKETGASTKIELSVTSDTKNPLYVLGLAASDAAVDDTKTYTGQNAKVILDGYPETEFTSNTFKAFGLIYTIKGQATPATPIEVTVNVKRDIEAEIKNIKDFINKYNEMLEKLKKTLDEPVYKNYQPLTDEERKALTEKQIEQWEEKAKSGLLRRDGILSGLVNSMRLNMTSIVDNGSKYNSLAAIGITSESYKDKGKLTVNEDKLREALEEDPEAVKNLFIQGSDITEEDVENDPTKQAKRGLIHRLNDSFGAAFKELTEKAGVTGNQADDQSIIGKMLQNLDARIYDMERRLIQKENRYYRQFTAMEKAMSKYNAQSAWLMQQFAGGSNGR
ncbi:flagellar filament capping protein FliD [Aneurinibacillus thermoaerophilus]|nr:flagellar filament capping protein FliD [Aneurinibacillus thermoaerophilus]MED0678251.1 flagellar filament capping protein FliD [Aneurinibacillus thermoaerophilus]